jgi:hypothetical protein
MIPLLVIGVLMASAGGAGVASRSADGGGGDQAVPAPPPVVVAEPAPAVEPAGTPGGGGTQAQIGPTVAAAVLPDTGDDGDDDGEEGPDAQGAGAEAPLPVAAPREAVAQQLALAPLPQGAGRPPTSPAVMALPPPAPPPSSAACRAQVDILHRAAVEMVPTSAGCAPTGVVLRLEECPCSPIFGEGVRLYYHGGGGPVFVTSCLARLPTG